MNSECSRDCFDCLLGEGDDEPKNGDDVDGGEADHNPDADADN